jgi:hypothetical protein
VAGIPQLNLLPMAVEGLITLRHEILNICSEGEASDGSSTGEL